jgi:hypothetical protein
MPSDKRLRLDDHQGVSPIKKACERDQRQPDRCCRRSRSDLALTEQSKLLAEEKILSDECGASAKKQTNECDQSPDLTKAGYNKGMVSVNRTAVVVRAKQPFLDWLHSADPTSRHLTLPDLNQEPSIYLLPDSDSNEKAGRYLRKFCAQIFAHELDGWFRVPSAWPKDLTFQVFTRWFECSYHSMVLDLADAPFLAEEACPSAFFAIWL